MRKKEIAGYVERIDNKRCCLGTYPNKKQCTNLVTIDNGKVPPYCLSCEEGWKSDIPDWIFCEEKDCLNWLINPETFFKRSIKNEKDIIENYKKCKSHQGKGYFYVGGTAKTHIETLSKKYSKRCLWFFANGKRCSQNPTIGSSGKLLPYCSKHLDLFDRNDEKFTYCMDISCWQWASQSNKDDESKIFTCEKHGGKTYLEGSFDRSEKILLASRKK